MDMICPGKHRKHLVFVILPLLFGTFLTVNASGPGWIAGKPGMAPGAALRNSEETTSDQVAFDSGPASAGVRAYESPAPGQQGDKQQESRHVENNTFKQGEILVFRAMYNSFLTGNVTAGEASLQILSQPAFIGGKECYHVVGEANTRGVFNLFFKVENRYDSYIHKESLAPLRFSRDVREGRYRRQDNVVFDHESRTATSERDTITTTPWVQDIISAFYFARTFDMSSVEPGDAFEVDFYLSDSVYVSRILYAGRERIRTRLGTFNTMKFKPQVLEGTVFSQPYPMTLWISDDKNKIPIRVESGLVVGTARLDLVTFGGLRHDLSSFVPRP